MKRFALALCAIGLLLTGCNKSQKPAKLANPAAAPSDSTTATYSPQEIDANPKKYHPLPPEIKSFARTKRRQSEALAKIANVALPPEVGNFFDAIEADDYRTSQVLYRDFRNLSNPNSKNPNHRWSNTPAWPPIMETALAAGLFAEGDAKYAFTYGRDIIASIRPGSIYFGGTDPGRGLITALSKSHEQADPFYTLTQNALADNTYLHYLHEIYGGKIYIPSDEDSQQVFNNFLVDAQDRLAQHKLKPGEDIQMKGGRVQVSGQTAVMEINALLVRLIFDKNPKKEFYVEESFPLDWMYPYLSPHDLIFKLNHDPLDTLTPEIVAIDEKYWTGRVDEWIGPWLTPETPMADVCAFAKKVFLQNDLSGFTGDPKFVQDDNASKSFSKLRSSISGVYAWRAKNAKDKAERERMTRAADFAFRQAYALCPYSPEALFRYVTLLTEGGNPTAVQMNDALKLVETANAIIPGNQQVESLLSQLQARSH